MPKVKKSKTTPSGSYNVILTTQEGHSGSKVYGEHQMYVEHAENSDDAYNQAVSRLSAARSVVKFVIIFLGAGGAIAQWGVDPFVGLILSAIVVLGLSRLLKGRQ